MDGNEGSRVRSMDKGSAGHQRGSLYTYYRPKISDMQPVGLLTPESK